MLDSLTF